MLCNEVLYSFHQQQQTESCHFRASHSVASCTACAARCANARSRLVRRLAPGAANVCSARPHIFLASDCRNGSTRSARCAQMRPAHSQQMQQCRHWSRICFRRLMLSERTETMSGRTGTARPESTVLAVCAGRYTNACTNLFIHEAVDHRCGCGQQVEKPLAADNRCCCRCS